MAIKDVKVWKGMAMKHGREARIYVHADDGREGVLYLTGNRQNPKGTTAGDLTDSEWKEARAMSIHDGKWNTVYANQRNYGSSKPVSYSSNRCPDCGTNHSGPFCPY